jgi:hypothetical protein
MWQCGDRCIQYWVSGVNPLGDGDVAEGAEIRSQIRGKQLGSCRWSRCSLFGHDGHDHDRRPIGIPAEEAG